MLRKVQLMVAAVLASVTVAAPASAEWFGDLYLGSAFTQNHDVTAKTTFIGVPFTVTGQDMHFDTSISGGGRAGYWFNAVPWLGVGLDVSHFQPDVSTQTVKTAITLGAVSTTAPIRFADTSVSVTDISFDLMLRWPGLMKSPQFPNGRLQPYFSVGPSIFIATAKDTTNFGPPSNQSSTDTSVGVTVGTGATWLITPHIGVFGEYRFTHFSPQFQFPTAAPFSKTTVDTDIDTHHLLVGATFRF